MTGWEMQTPDETKSYSIDWSLETGEGIEESIWTITPDLGLDTGAALDSEVIDSSEMTTTVVVSGLAVGQTYQLKNVVRTNQNKILSREMTIRCANK